MVTAMYILGESRVPQMQSIPLYPLHLCRVLGEAADTDNRGRDSTSEGADSG